MNKLRNTCSVNTHGPTHFVSVPKLRKVLWCDVHPMNSGQDLSQEGWISVLQQLGRPIEDISCSFCLVVAPKVISEIHWSRWLHVDSPAETAGMEAPIGSLNDFGFASLCSRVFQSMNIFSKLYLTSPMAFNKRWMMVPVEVSHSSYLSKYLSCLWQSHCIWSAAFFYTERSLIITEQSPVIFQAGTK